MKIIAGTLDFSYDLASVDVNLDGVITTADMIWILQSIAN